MGLELSRWMIALGSVAATVGLTVAGISMSYVDPVDSLIQLGVILMIGGLAVFAIGMVTHHRLDDSDTSFD